MAPDPTVSLLALVLWQARTDGAGHVEFFADEARMTYNLDGTDYELVPPPVYALRVLCWLLTKVARAKRPGDTGQINFGQSEPTTGLVVTRLDQQPPRRVRVSLVPGVESAPPPGPSATPPQPD